ncbi:MAG TPA: NAD(P)-binding protein [Vicinamibacterales bacterium]|nr:NAD(P)-binding protein [Vicinamibacterales bacterium]
MARITTVDEVPSGTPMAVSLKSTRELVTGNWRTFRPVWATRPSPCNLDCPAGTDVRAYLQHAADGNIEAAWRTILEHNPLPGICGRVCYHPCERNCNRTGLDGAVAVHAIERAIADEARLRRLVVERSAPSNHARAVAIIGAGPAGLSCAYHLALRGHLPTMFDAMPEPGGMLRYGIPPYRLPREVLDAELETLWHLGVGFQGGARFGESLAWEDLNSYAAVFIAIGANRSRPARVTGDDLPGVRSGLDFLRAANAGQETAIDGRVVVVGGGNTALDAARTALRLGAAAVTVAYRRGREHMPAHPDEIAQAEAEGIEFLFEVAPVKFADGAGRVASVELQRMRLGAPDASGRPRPEPLPGSEFRIPARHVFTAIGEDVEIDPFVPAVDTDRGRFYADVWGRTTLPAVFAGGDAATGAGMVVNAIGSGRHAAEAIDAWLAGRDPVELGQAERVGLSDVNFFYFRPAARAPQAHLPRTRAIATMEEVVAGLDWRTAAREARRCMTCGSCTECDNCLVFCPDAAVRHDARAGTYSVDLSHCKGCGICATECPRGAITLAPEEQR